MQDFRKLTVWQRSHQLALATYRATARFPREERFGLMRPMRRASVSMPANIAEGCGRLGQKEFARFLSIAMGSASELQYFVILGTDLGFLDHEDVAGLETSFEGSPPS